MSNKLTDDIYVFSYYDKEENSFGMGIAQSLEEFKEVKEAFTIVSWGNITGKDMSVTEFHVDRDIGFVESKRDEEQ